VWCCIICSFWHDGVSSHIFASEHTISLYFCSVQQRVLSPPIAVQPCRHLSTWLPTATYPIMVVSCRSLPTSGRAWFHVQHDDRSSAAAGPRLWNRLPLSMRHYDTTSATNRITELCDFSYAAPYKNSYLLTYVLTYLIT